MSRRDEVNIMREADEEGGTRGRVARSNESPVEMQRLTTIKVDSTIASFPQPSAGWLPGALLPPNFLLKVRILSLDNCILKLQTTQFPEVDESWAAIKSFGESGGPGVGEYFLMLSSLSGNAEYKFARFVRWYMQIKTGGTDWGACFGMNMFPGTDMAGWQPKPRMI